MVSRSQILSFPSGILIVLAFCPHSCFLSAYNVACCCSRHFNLSQRLEVGSKKLCSFKSLFFIWEENLSQVPQIFPCINYIRDFPLHP